ALQPGAGEGNRAGDVAPASRAFGSPPVVGGQRPDIDDREVGVAEALSKFGQGDVRVRNAAGRIGAGHRYIDGGQWLSSLLLGNRAIMPEIVDYVNLSSQDLPNQRRSEEHTSELQSLAYLVCRLLPDK